MYSLHVLGSAHISTAVGAPKMLYRATDVTPNVVFSQIKEVKNLEMFRRHIERRIETEMEELFGQRMLPFDYKLKQKIGRTRWKASGAVIKRIWISPHERVLHPSKTLSLEFAFKEAQKTFEGVSTC